MLCLPDKKVEALGDCRRAEELEGCKMAEEDCRTAAEGEDGKKGETPGEHFGSQCWRPVWQRLELAGCSRRQQQLCNVHETQHGPSGRSPKERAAARGCV